MNLGYLVRTAAAKYTDRTAVVEGEARISFRQFNERINRLARGCLDKLGLARGDRVALLLNNCHQYMEARLALEKCGVIWVPLNTLLGEGELAYIIRDSEVKAIVTEKLFFPKISEVIRELGLATVWVGPAPQELAFRIHGFEDLIAGGDPGEPPVEVGAGDFCSINYTSGTTGKPKGVLMSQNNWINVYRNMLVDRDIRSDDVLAHIGPLTHASGSYFMPYFLKGAANVIIPGGFNIPLFVQTLEREKVTTFTCVPTMLIRLINHPDLKKYHLGSLRNIGYGAAPAPVEVIKEAIGVFGPILTQNYGQTEAYMTVSYLPKEEHQVEGPEAVTRRLASVGRPYTFVEVRIVDDLGRDIKPGERGEIIVRSDHVMQGYWRLPGETAEVLKEGWLYTGDVATVDEDGYIYLLDRKKDMIISGGFNIYPREVEEALYTHPSVMEAAVIGVPDPEWGEKVKALVMLKEGKNVSEEELISYCKERIGFKCPRVIEFVSEIPKSGTGKIDKKALRQRYNQG